MSKSTKIIAGVGVAALAVAAIPAISHAATTAEVEYEVVIEPTLSLAVDDADLSYTLTNNGSVGTGQKSTFTAITNNLYGYTVTATDADTNLVAANIGTIAYGSPAQGTSAWKLASTGTDDTTPTAATIGDLAKADLEGAGAMVDYSHIATDDDGDEFDVEYAASASATQAAGTYTDTVLYTITANAS